MLEAARILAEKGLPYRLIYLTDRATTVADVLRFSRGDFAAEEVCKTVIVRDAEGGRYAFFLIGSDRVDFPKARDVTVGSSRLPPPPRCVMPRAWIPALFAPSPSESR
jgi:prolyl-tRNA editing enzyme YbaK/EbsC (Cys-tRNA(Pro) deacylase)